VYASWCERSHASSLDIWTNVLWALLTVVTFVSSLSDSTEKSCIFVDKDGRMRNAAPLVGISKSDYKEARSSCLSAETFVLAARLSMGGHNSAESVEQG